MPLLMTLGWLAGACASAPEADAILAYGCDDVVAIGRLQNGEFQPVANEKDLLGHGWIDAELKVRRVIKGSGAPPTVHLRYYGHTYMRDDEDFMFVLGRNDAGGFLIKNAQLMSYHPRPATRCTAR